MGNSLLMNGILGLIMSLLLIVFSGQILQVMNLPKELMGYGTQFLTIIGGFSFLQALLSASSAILRSHGDTRTAMIIALGMNIVNVCGNFLVLFGFFGLPVLGVKGVAINTSISQALGVITVLIVIKKKMKINISLRKMFSFNKEIVSNILKIGIPSAGEVFAYQISQLVITYIITLMGTEALTTRVITFNIMWFIMITGMSLGQSTQILVGHKVGAGEYDQAYKLCLRSLRLGSLIAFGISILLLLFNRQFFSLFTQNPNIVSKGAVLLALAVILEPGRVFNLVIMNSSKAAGDVKFPVILSMISPWGIAIPISYFLGIYFGMGLTGIWIAYIADEWLRGIIMHGIRDQQGAVAQRPAARAPRELRGIGRLRGECRAHSLGNPFGELARFLLQHLLQGFAASPCCQFTK
jgi:putative MATE family efflux protein